MWQPPVTTIGVTGATGFIAGALIPALAADGHELLLVDDRSGPTTVERPDFPVPKADFASEESLDRLSASDLILHLAAISGVMACAQEPAASARVNVEGTRRLYEMCLREQIPVAFASSFAVVGAPESLPVTERTPARPTHEYARQKAAGELLTRELAEKGKFGTAVLRQSNVYGFYMAGERRVTKSNVLEMFARQIPSGRLRVNAPGTQRRDFIHILDVVAHWQAAVRWLVGRGASARAATFSVASGEAFSVLELADRVVRSVPRLRPDLPVPVAEIVPNPREGIELIEPGFSIDPAETERVLSVRCAHRLDDELPGILGGRRDPLPRP